MRRDWDENCFIYGRIQLLAKIQNRYSELKFVLNITYKEESILNWKNDLSNCIICNGRFDFFKELHKFN